jgi:sec-independent protein translocase protein TatC
MERSAEMPFLDHLEELRWRIIWSLAAVVVGVILGFVIVIEFNLLEWMQGPIRPYLHGRRLMNTHPGGGFAIMMQTAIIIGMVIALPMILYQTWLFLSPALHRHEKKVVLPVILGGVMLFVAGAALAWYFVLPMTLRFLTGMGEDAFDQMISANEYFGFVTTMVLAMGAVFELPILVVLLSLLGLVTPHFLGKFRRHALVGSYLVGAFVTPGDYFIGSVALMVPLYLLYEMSIGLSWVIYRHKQKKAAAEALESAEASG